jgi:uncharacterized protein (TIGR00375 family)
MKFVADLHLHSAYSRATSKSLNFDTLSSWAKLKGIGLLSSADFTHPVWFKEIKSKLKDIGNGLFEYGEIKFILGTEISCIYTQGGRQRRIHCLLFFPEIKSVEEFNSELGKSSNLSADGRPIIGLSAKELLELSLSINEKAILIPAHAWTPWFSLYGSNSGFDSIDECFGDLSKYIYAVETGLSSDPAMNWRTKDLDNRSIVSFSDAHSTPKMGRELTIFDTDLSYAGILKALKKEKISMTVEFFPEEGKYHFTGHRSCGIRHSPRETAKLGIMCPKCAKRLTVGVMHRVDQLAEGSRPEGYKPGGRPPYKMMVPLQEIVAEVLGSSVSSEKVRGEYMSLVKELGSEMSVLLKAKLPDIEKVASSRRMAEAVDKVRRGDIKVDPGFDGVYGTVKIWPARNAKYSVAGGPDDSKKEVQKVSEQAEGQIGLFESKQKIL